MLTTLFTHPDRRAAGLVALVVLALSLVACGDHEAGTGTPHARPGSALGKPVDRLRPPPERGVIDTSQVTVARLDPDLLSALQDAARDALHDRVRIEVTSGWRSWEHQQRLFDEAVAKYGSEQEARRYVALPAESAHVTGDAVDVGPTEAAVWLGQHGSAYGLCQIFANEIWHFELATSPGGQCPAMYVDGASR